MLLDTNILPAPLVSVVLPRMSWVARFVRTVPLVMPSLSMAKQNVSPVQLATPRPPASKPRVVLAVPALILPIMEHPFVVHVREAISRARMGSHSVMNARWAKLAALKEQHRALPAQPVRLPTPLASLNVIDALQVLISVFLANQAVMNACRVAFPMKLDPVSAKTVILAMLLPAMVQLNALLVSQDSTNGFPANLFVRLAQRVSLTKPMAVRCARIVPLDSLVMILAWLNACHALLDLFNLKVDRWNVFSAELVSTSPTTLERSAYFAALVLSLMLKVHPFAPLALQDTSSLVWVRRTVSSAQSALRALLPPQSCAPAALQDLIPTKLELLFATFALLVQPSSCLGKLDAILAWLARLHELKANLSAMTVLLAHLLIGALLHHAMIALLACINLKLDKPSAGCATMVIFRTSLAAAFATTVKLASSAMSKDQMSARSARLASIRVAADSATVTIVNVADLVMPWA